MRRVLIKELFSKPEEFFEKEVIVKGWLKSIRNSKAFSFVILNDGSCFKDLQIIANDDLANYEAISAMRTGFAISVKGKIVPSGGKQPLEMQAIEVEIVGEAPEDYPLQKKATSLEFLREVAHVRGRSNTISNVLRVRHHLAMATHQFFHDRGYYYAHTPIITASDCEGAGDLFRVSTLPAGEAPKNDKGSVDFGKDYFGTETFLCVSGQLEAEALALSLGAVYTFGPTFRSENSNTARHLAEFWMIEPEVAFADLDDVALLAADYIKYLINWALEKCPDEIEFFNLRIQKGLKETLEHVVKSEFQRVTYTEAVDILKASGKKFEYKVEWGADLQTEHERYLTEEHYKAPVIVTDYPKEIKSFYMKENKDGKTVRAMDVLVPGVGELMGGSQREDNLEVLKRKMKEKGLNEEEYWWYLDLRRFGGCPHAGFGMGFERAVMYITGVQNIRDTIPFPRFPKNASF